MKQNLLGNAFFMVCLSALLAACGKQEQTVRPQPVVRVARAETIASEAARSYTFISEPVRVTQLAFRVGGPVEDFTVQAGQFFRQGQPIAAIDRRDFLIRRDRAEALCRQAADNTLGTSCSTRGWDVSPISSWCVLPIFPCAIRTACSRPKPSWP